MKACRLAGTVRAVVVLGVTVVVAGCGGPSPSPTAGTPAPTSTAAPTASAVATATAPPQLSAADAAALLGKLVVPNSGYWYECDLPPQNLASCPLTPKLAQRIPILSNEVAPGGVGGGPTLLRQQFFAAAPSVVSTTPTATGATMQIQLNIGDGTTPHLVHYDLAVVNSAGSWLVDDISCAGQPATSAYLAPTAPNWTCT